jgi:hypothetical protein
MRALNSFGSFFDLLVTIDIPSVSESAISGSSFAIGVLDSDFLPGLTNDPLVRIDFDAESGEALVTNNSAMGEATVTPTPEPISIWLSLIGIVGILALRRGLAKAPGA